jgi:hypothetical protein
MDFLVLLLLPVEKKVIYPRAAALISMAFS